MNILCYSKKLTVYARHIAIQIFVFGVLVAHVLSNIRILGAFIIHMYALAKNCNIFATDYKLKYNS